MMTHLTSRSNTRRPGFTLVELLVGMTIIAILAGMLTVAVSRAFISAQEFSVKNDMIQIESALEQFNNKFGFYPPSFKNMTLPTFQSYINRISPNNAESSPLPAGVEPTTGIMRPAESRFQRWWALVGADLVTAANSDPTTAPNARPGSDLVFWLCGITKNRQFPLTAPDGRLLAAHNYTPGGDSVERNVIYEFDQTRVQLEPNAGLIANFVQGAGAETPILYRDALSYLPSDPEQDNSADGVYVRAGVTKQDIIDAAYQFDQSLPASSNITNAPNPIAESVKTFNSIYYNPDTYQLISFGLDGLPGGPSTCPTPLNLNPNTISATCSQGADNFVNFGGSGMTKLQTVVEEVN